MDWIPVQRPENQPVHKLWNSRQSLGPNERSSKEEKVGSELAWGQIHFKMELLTVMKEMKKALREWERETILREATIHVRPEG